jgi:CheY-like chemotaxis protein
MQRVLVLENYPPTRRALALTLQRAGWEVGLAQTDQETLEIVGQKLYDVLLLDMSMPTGDGWTVLEALWAVHNTPPVVALVESESHSQRRLQALGVRIILSKPVGREALIAGVQAALEDHSPA